MLTDHLVQKGPAFQRPMEVLVDNATGQVRVRYTDEDAREKVISDRLELPPDVANGMIFTLRSASTKNSVASWKRKRWPCPILKRMRRLPNAHLRTTTCCRARGDLLEKLSRLDEARAEFERAFSSYRRILSISSVDPLLRERAVSHFI